MIYRMMYTSRSSYLSLSSWSECYYTTSFRL